MRTELHIPGIMRWQMPDTWTKEERNLFLDGLRNAWLTGQTTVIDTWPDIKKRGFRLGDRVLWYCQLHNLPTKRLTHTGVKYEFSGYHKPDHTGRGRSALFPAYATLQ